MTPTMIAPGYEPRLALNFHFIDVTYVPTQELLAHQRQEEIRSRIKAMDMPKDIQEANFCSSMKVLPGRGEALMAAVEFIENLKNDPRAFHKGLYLVGSFGIGKTYLLRGQLPGTFAEAGYTTTLVHFPDICCRNETSNRQRLVGDKTQCS